MAAVKGSAAQCPCISFGFPSRSQNCHCGSCHHIQERKERQDTAPVLLASFVRRSKTPSQKPSDFSLLFGQNWIIWPLLTGRTSIYLMHACMLSHFSSVQFSHSVVSDSAIPCIAAHQASLSITNSRSLLKLMSIESVMPSNLILCRPLLLLPSIFPDIRMFSKDSVIRIRWPKYWSFSFSISPSSEYSGLISFRMDWLNLLAVHGTLKSLIQHYSLKASILWYSAFFMVQLSHPLTISGKTIALTIQIFAGKAMPLLFSMLHGFFIAFLPRS